VDVLYTIKRKKYQTVCAELAFTKSLGRYVAPLGHIILIPSQPVFALSKINKNKIKIGNRIGSVMVSVLASSAIDCGYELRSCQTKEYSISFF
jgi:hypothetical protein